MSGIGSYSIQLQKRLYLNPIATQLHFLVSMARIRSIGIKTGAVSTHHAVAAAQFNFLFFYLIGVNFENHSNHSNDKNPGCNSLRIFNVNVKNAMQKLQFTD